MLEHKTPEDISYVLEYQSTFTWAELHEAETTFNMQPHYVPVTWQPYAAYSTTSFWHGFDRVESSYRTYISAFKHKVQMAKRKEKAIEA